MDLSNISKFGWTAIIIICSLIFIVLIALIIVIGNVIFKKNIKTKIFDITDIEKNQKDMYRAEGKDILENQCQVAKQLLKELRIKLFKTGMDIYKFENQKDVEILELLTYRIVDRLNYDVRNDLTRNHITSKTDSELVAYSEAKAKGYYFLIKDRFYIWNSKLPEFNLPKIIESIPEMEIKNIFTEIYFSARSIAGIGEAK